MPRTKTMQTLQDYSHPLIQKHDFPATTMYSKILYSVIEESYVKTIPEKANILEIYKKLVDIIGWDNFLLLEYIPAYEDGRKIRVIFQDPISYVFVNYRIEMLRTEKKLDALKEQYMNEMTIFPPKTHFCKFATKDHLLLAKTMLGL